MCCVTEIGNVVCDDAVASATALCEDVKCGWADMLLGIGMVKSEPSHKSPCGCSRGETRLLPIFDIDIACNLQDWVNGHGKN